MKHHCALLAALLLPICAAAADQVWRADLATTEVRNLYLRHGESADLTARLYLRGTPYAPTNAVAYYQTNGMAQAWWSAPCSIASNTVSVAWTPELDPGADLVSLLIRLDDSAYRAAAMLYLRPSPGAAPNLLPPPTQWLDFDKIAWTNAPWALAGGAATPAALAAAALAATNYTDTAVAGVTAASIGALTAETDPTVPSWAKAASKPSYTASEVGAATPAALAAAALAATNYTDTAVAGVTAASIGALTAETDPTVPAWAKADNPPSGGADMGQVSNLVAGVVAEVGASAAATEIWRIVLADLQRRLDALEDADGTDALTEAQAEAIVDAKCETWATNAIAEIEAAYRSAVRLATEAAYTFDLAQRTLDFTSDNIEATQYTSSGGASIELSPGSATRYYRSASASSTLTISSFTGAHNYPCWLLIDGYGSVTWPNGSAYAGTAYPGTAGAVYRVFKLNSKVYIERVY